MNFPLYMARRLYGQGQDANKVSRSAIYIATLGVALGVAIMILSVSVVMGFKQEISNKVTGIGNHIQILNYETLYSSESQPIQISRKMIQKLEKHPEIESVQTFCLKTGMLKTDESFQGVVFKGLGEDYHLDFLRQSLVDGEIAEPFSRTENTKQLIISRTLSSTLALSVGDKVYAYFFDGKLRARRFTIAAIYQTNMSEFDNKLVFCDYSTTHQLLDYEADQCSGAEVCIKDLNKLDQVSQYVVDNVNHKQDRYGKYYTSPTIKELYQNIFGWLDLQDLNAIVILILMICVAAFTIISGLLIIILERTQFIGVMKALGATNTSLRHLFIYYSIFIIGRGLLLGNIIGLGLCFVQIWFGVIHLDPETYYVDTVPVIVHWGYVIAINVLTLVTSTLALIIPSFLVSRISPSQSMRFD